MRIRKHAKVSPLTYAASSLKPGTHLHTHVCQLNQSPWDVITFPPEEEDEGSSSMLLLPPPTQPPPPPPSFLFDGCESYPPNGSFNDSNEAVQSAESAMLSPGWDYSNRIAAAAGYSPAEEGAAEQEEVTIFCSKTDGRAWQCKREARKGHALCAHHLEQLKNYSNQAHPTRPAAAATVKKSEKLTAPAEDSPMTNRCRRSRPKKPLVSTNPYELYYYTGFGPLWGKKRGPGRASGTTSSSSDLANASEHDRGNGTASSASEMDDGEFDYLEDEYEDEDDEDEFDDGRRKKARKPIKARSLKSLM